MLLVPATYNYGDINAPYLQVNPETASSIIVPIQIAVNSTHHWRLSSESFYAQWEKWQAHYCDYQLTTTFVWIVEDERAHRVVQEKTRETRTHSVVISLEFTEIFITMV
jgi:hypothetical protein